MVAQSSNAVLQQQVRGHRHRRNDKAPASPDHWGLSHPKSADTVLSRSVTDTSPGGDDDRTTGGVQSGPLRADALPSLNTLILKLTMKLDREAYLFLASSTDQPSLIKALLAFSPAVLVAPSLSPDISALAASSNTTISWARCWRFKVERVRSTTTVLDGRAGVMTVVLEWQ